MIRDAGGVAFGGGENFIGERALEISNRRAVDVMEDERHAGAPGRDSSENARLAAVGMNEVGLLFAKDFFQFSERDEIFQRMNGADQFGDDGQGRDA